MGINWDQTAVPEKDVLYIGSGDYKVEKKDADNGDPITISMADKENMIKVESGSPAVNLRVDDESGENMAALSSLEKGDPFRITLRNIDEEKETKIIIEGSADGNGEVKAGFNEKQELVLEHAEGVTITSDDGSYNTVKGLTLDKKLIILDEGSSATLAATLNPASNAKVTWKSKDTKVVTVDDKGTVKGAGTGRTEITGTARDYASGKEFSDTCTVIVRSKKHLAAKQKTDVKPLFNESCTKFVIKNKAEKKIAKVSKKGILKGKKSGTVTITGQDTSGQDVEEITFTVEEPKFGEKRKNFSIEEDAEEGDSFDPMTLMAEGVNIQPDKWESSKADVAEVDETTGLVTFKGKKGTAKITAYYGEEKNAAKLTLKLKVK